MALTEKQKKDVLLKYGYKNIQTSDTSGIDIDSIVESRFEENKASRQFLPETKAEQTFGKGFISGAVDVGVGALKGAGQTLQNIGRMVTKPISAITGIEDKTGIPEENLEAKNTQQKVGKFLERTAEFILPASKVSKLTTGLSKGARIGAQVASDVGVAVSQEGDLKAAIPTAVVSAGISAIPIIGRFIAKPTTKVTGNIAKNLEMINLRLTPTQKLALRDKADDVVKFINKNKVVGSPEARYAKSLEVVDQFENSVQSLLKQSGKSYSKEEIITAINSIPDQYLQVVDNPEVYNRMLRDIKSFSNFIDAQKGLTISAERVNAFKRSFAKNARNKAGDTVVNESREAISDGLYTILQRDIKELKPINKEYSTALLTKKLLGKAVGRNELGLIGNIISLSTGGALGGAVGGPVGAGIGAVAGPTLGRAVAGTQMRSRIASGLQSLTEYMKNAQTTPSGDFIIPKGIIQSLIGLD